MESSKQPAPVAGTTGPPGGEDLRLVADVLRRDRKATAEFVARYSDPLYAYLAKRLSPRVDLTEDMLQEVFLSAWENLENYEGRSSLHNWLLGIARHKVETHYRATLRAPFPLDEDGLDEPAWSGPGADDWLEHAQMLDRAAQALEALPEHYRVVLRWRYWEGCKATDMAERTGKTEKAVERLLARARQAFRKEWTDE